MSTNKASLIPNVYVITQSWFLEAKVGQLHICVESDAEPSSAEDLAIRVVIGTCRKWLPENSVGQWFCLACSKPRLSSMVVLEGYMSRWMGHHLNHSPLLGVVSLLCNSSYITPSFLCTAQVTKSRECHSAVVPVVQSTWTQTKQKGRSAHVQTWSIWAVFFWFLLSVAFAFCLFLLVYSLWYLIAWVGHYKFRVWGITLLQFLLNIDGKQFNEMVLLEVD